jgi:hypothetical protein
MLSESDQQLLTAYVDGEISARQSRQLLKLIRRSPEARQLLQQMQENCRTLRRLPRVRSHPALSDSVLQQIQALRLKPRTKSPPVRHPVVRAWAGYGAAAALLLVVAGASFLFFAHSLQPDTQPAVVQNGPAVEGNQPQPHDPTPPIAQSGSAGSDSEKLPVAPRREEPMDPTPIVQGPPRDDSKPLDPEKPRDPNVATAPVDLVELKMVDIAAPLIVKLQDVDPSNTKGGVLAEFNKASAFRVEFPCRNGSRSFERFQAACKSQDIGLNVDQTAAERLKHPHYRTNYAIYLDDVTPEELTKLLQQVAGEDKKPDAKKVVDAQFDRIVLVRLGKRDHKELAELLGTDPTVSATPTGPLRTDVHKAVSDQTGSQIAATLTGQGGAPPRPDGDKPAMKAGEHSALVVPYTPLRPAANSVEVKRYLDTRKAARPGTLQVLLVLRETGA